MTDESAPPATPPGPLPPSLSRTPTTPTPPPVPPGAPGWSANQAPRPKKAVKWWMILLVIMGMVGACCVGGVLVAVQTGNNINITPTTTRSR